jgi:plasmid stabilization system protein ParE
MKSLEVVVESEAKSGLRNIYSYIKKGSETNARIFKRDILGAIGKLSLNPQKHPPDKFKRDNDGSYRAFELYHVRITFHVSESQITIIRIGHTKRNPIEY